MCGADNRRLISARHLHSRLAALTAPVTSANERAARHCGCCYQIGYTVYEGKPVELITHDMMGLARRTQFSATW